jgi:hypothetical protein
MRSRRLQTALTSLIESAAGHLQAAIDAGAEVPFELGSQSGRGRSTRLYSYKALTGAFITEREHELARLDGYGEAESLLEAFDGLERYLASTGAPAAPKAKARARAAITALLRDVFDEQTDFELRPERMHAALERLERAQAPSSNDLLLVATLHGLTISSSELALTKGLTIAHPDALRGMPAGAEQGGAGTDNHLIVALGVAEDEHASDEADARDAIAQGREVLNDLLRALRLFGDGRVTLGGLAWARIGDGGWNPVALGAGGRPYGMLVVTVEQEDELRAFCNLVSRRAPHGNELAWALRRFELGCERESPFEGLSDHLLALRVLLEPEGPSSGLLPGRLAALCATPEQRLELTERVIAALTLEHAAITGGSLKRAGGPKLAREIGDHLRALLRDVICGHLTPELPALADELLCAPESVEDDPPAQDLSEPALA